MKRRQDDVTLGGTWDHLHIRPLGRLLSKLVLRGFLATVDQHRQAVVAGQMESLNPDLPAITITNVPLFTARLLRHGNLGFGEAFIEREWRGGVHSGDDLQFETDAVVDWLAIYADKLTRRERLSAVGSRLGWRWRMPQSHRNSGDGARRNIALHYDLPIEFFRIFLDADMVYSCADFRKASTLEAAQREKIRDLLLLAEVERGSHILDIGCGWGALLIHAATDWELQGTGITVSQSQFQHCKSQITDNGLSGMVDVHLQDYRDHSGSYDAVVSVEMIEAVGSEYWAQYFRKIESLLKPRATAVIQAVTFPHSRMKRSLGNYSWVDRYIFPGGELISLEEIERLLARETSLEITSQVRLSSSYARTLREWRHRFCAGLDRLRALGFDERFIRVWTLYLAYFEAGFRSRYVDVWQLQLKRRVPTQ